MDVLSIHSYSKNVVCCSSCGYKKILVFLSTCTVYIKTDMFKLHTLCSLNGLRIWRGLVILVVWFLLRIDNFLIDMVICICLGVFLICMFKEVYEHVLQQLYDDSTGFVCNQTAMCEVFSYLCGVLFNVHLVSRTLSKLEYCYDLLLGDFLCSIYEWIQEFLWMFN